MGTQRVRHHLDTVQHAHMCSSNSVYNMEIIIYFYSFKSIFFNSPFKKYLFFFQFSKPKRLDFSRTFRISPGTSVSCLALGKKWRREGISHEMLKTRQCSCMALTWKRKHCSLETLSSHKIYSKVCLKALKFSTWAAQFLWMILQWDFNHVSRQIFVFIHTITKAYMRAPLLARCWVHMPSALSASDKMFAYQQQCVHKK